MHAGDCVDLAVHDCLIAKQLVLLIFFFGGGDCKYKLLKFHLPQVISIYLFSEAFLFYQCNQTPCKLTASADGHFC